MYTYLSNTSYCLSLLLLGQVTYVQPSTAIANQLPGQLVSTQSTVKNTGVNIRPIPPI